MENNRHLIPDTKTLQLFVRVNISVLKNSFLPFELDAQQKYLLPYLGKDLHEELLAYVKDQVSYPSWATTNEIKSIFNEVLRLSRNALSKFTLQLAAPHMDLHLSEMGFVVTDATGSSPASAERVRKLVEAYDTQGYDNLETLLRYLEKNHQHIDSYKESEAFVLANANLINSAETFNRIVFIGGSRRRFISLKPEMDNIERLVIEPVISIAMADKLRGEIRNNNLTADNKKLLDLLQRALAHLVIADDITIDDVPGAVTRKRSGGSPSKSDEQALFDRKQLLRGSGNNYLAWVKRLLEKDPDKYPEYKSSEQFVETRTYSSYDNSSDTEDKTIFIFGQP